MSRMIKEKMVEKYQTKFRDVADVAVVSMQGVDVLKLTALRGTLRAKGIRAMTVQNRICRRALEATPLSSIGPLLRGPSTVVWGSDSIVGLAKALTAEAKTTAKMEIRGGVSGGQVLSKTDIEALSKMPSREELLGQVVGRAMGPAARVASMLTSSAAGVVSQVREIEKKAPAEPAAAEAAPAAPEAPAAPSV
jgi:large subunit ribosomal protein L10